MFMRRNRALNGAPQPEAIETQGAGMQRAQDVLSPNDENLGSPQHRTFEADRETIPAIVARRRVGIETSFGGPDYGNMVPVGPTI